jgi:Zn-dependent alcohol dehydrogenase
MRGLRAFFAKAFVARAVYSLALEGINEAFAAMKAGEVARSIVTF